jgi:hypothetical protein
MPFPNAVRGCKWSVAEGLRNGAVPLCDEVVRILLPRLPGEEEAMEVEITIRELI